MAPSVAQLALWSELVPSLTGLGIVLLVLVLVEALYVLAFALFVTAGRSHGRGGSCLLLVLAVGFGLNGGGSRLEAATQARDTPRQLAPDEDRYRPATPLGLDEYYPVPESNTLTVAKVSLGRRLFFDPALSADGSIACASCHRPERAFSDTVAFSPSVYGRKTARNTPSILNRVYGRTFFRDGRTASLEATVLKPIENRLEMDLELSELVSRLRRDGPYARYFEETFEDGVTQRNVARALASYVRTILAGDSPLDRYYSGDRDALSPNAREGVGLFRGKANCASCHVGPNFTDESFHVTGVAWRSGAPADSGRHIVTGRDRDVGAFKTPTLREIARTAPYMHDGSLQTLEDVVDFYDRGGHENPYLDREIRPLRLSAEEKRFLLAFLRSLAGTVREGLDVGSGG